MTSEEKAEVDREYLDEAATHTESNVDGVGEAPEETAGIAGARRGITFGLVLLLGLILGGTVVTGYTWWTTRPTPKTHTLTQGQYDVLWGAADPGSRGYNDNGIGALRAVGYKPVAQQVDDRTRTYFIVMVMCAESDYRACASNLKPNPDPVVYLGLGKELKEGDAVPRLNPLLLLIDLKPREGGGVQRCTLRDAQVGEPGTISYELPGTLNRLKAVFSDRQTQDPDGESLDNSSYWTCERR